MPAVGKLILGITNILIAKIEKRSLTPSFLIFPTVSSKKVEFCFSFVLWLSARKRNAKFGNSRDQNGNVICYI